METVEERLEKLERRVDRYRKASMVLAALLVVGVTMGQAKPEVIDTLRCRRLAIVDAQGEPRVILGVADDGPSLFMSDAQGNPRVSLGVVGDNQCLSLYDAQGKTLMKLTSGDTGGQLGVFNKTGESIGTMYADEYGNGVVGAWNRKGKGRTLTPGP